MIATLAFPEKNNYLAFDGNKVGEVAVFLRKGKEKIRRDQKSRKK